MEKADLNSILLQNILQYGNIGIHMIDKNRRTIIYNQTMANLEGMEISQVMGKDILDVFPSLNEQTSTLIKSMETGEPIINSTQTYLNFKGYSITTISTTMPLYENSTIIGALEIAQDITSVRKLSDQLFHLQKELQPENKSKDKGKIRRYSFRDIIGNNKELVQAREVARKASAFSSGVLIYGETGTGKEIFAQSIHYEGNRSDKPFIAQNCAAIPETLLEGILFGTEKGGFTGAVEREGIFEQANGGTLLLDEINSMTLSLQAKLLRVLQEGYIRRIGGTRDIPIDVRIIATTNEHPHESIGKGNLRRDLFYRLSVINIHIPTLRERADDVQLLSSYFIDKYNMSQNKNVKGLSEEVLRDFKEYSWPGNIRELENFIEGAMNMVSPKKMILEREDFITSVFIPSKFSMGNKLEIKLKEKSLPDILAEIEIDLIESTLKKHNHNVSTTARHLGIKRQTLQHKLKKYEKGGTFN